jgi:predicted esterase
MNIKQIDYIPAAVSGLEAMIFLAENNKEAPTVFVIHGRGGNIYKRFDLARNIRKNGMNAVTIELRNHGRRFVDQSNLFEPGNKTLLEVSGMAIGSAQDISLLIDLLHVQYNLITENLGVIGISLGAITANILMTMDQRIKACVSAIAPGYIKGIVEFRKKAGKITEEDKNNPQYEQGINYLSRKYNSLEHLRTLKDRPLLLLAGKDAKKLPAPLIKSYWNTIKEFYTDQRKIQYREYEDTEHTFSPEMEEESINWFLKWL